MPWEQPMRKHRLFLRIIVVAWGLRFKLLLTM
jgi:hypothetical protein